MAVVKVAYVLVACMVVLGAVRETEGTITCALVAKSVAPCITYIQGGGVVPGPCCSGLKSLNSAAGTPADRRAACFCLKNIAKGISGINYGLAGSLPGKCGVRVPYKISPGTDCNKVN